jgi:type IV secretion system protein VirB5
VVVTGNLGRPVASGLADQASTADEQLKRSIVIEWVENLRLVTTDGIAQRRAIDRVYAHIASGSPAQTFISDFYRNGQPFTRAQTEIVSVDVQSVLQDSEETFGIEWLETIRDLYGAVKEKERWKGAFSIAINPPKDERLARINPLGVYVPRQAGREFFEGVLILMRRQTIFFAVLISAISNVAYAQEVSFGFALAPSADTNS